MSVRMKKKTRVRNIALALFLTLVFVQEMIGLSNQL